MNWHFPSQSFRILIISMFKRSGCWCQPAQEQRRTQNEKVSQLIWKSLCELTLSISILSYFNNFHVQAKLLYEPPKSPKTKAAKNSERKGQSINLKIPLWIDTFHLMPWHILNLAKFEFRTGAPIFRRLRAALLQHPKSAFFAHVNRFEVPFFFVLPRLTSNIFYHAPQQQHIAALCIVYTAWRGRSEMQLDLFLLI